MLQSSREPAYEKFVLHGNLVSSGLQFELACDSNADETAVKI